MNIWDIRLRSATRGRERWEVKALAGRADVAQELEQALMERPGILKAHANPISGRILIFYSPNVPNLDIESLIKDCLNDILLSPARSSFRSDGKGSPLYRILKTSLPERKQLFTPLALSVTGQSIHLLQVTSLISTVHTAQGGSGPGFLRIFGVRKQRSRLFFMTAVSLLLAGADLLLQYYRKRVWRRLALTTQHTLRARLFSHIQSQDMEFFDRYGTGRLINLVSEDTAHIGEFIDRAGDSSIERGLLIVVAGVGLAKASPRLALFTLLPVSIIFPASRYFQRAAARQYARLGQLSGSYSQRLENTLSGIAVVKSFTAEQREARRLHACDKELGEASFEASSTSSLLFHIGQSTYYLGSSLMAGYGGRIHLKGKISADEYSRTVYWFPHLLGAITGVEEITKLYHSATVSAARLTEVFDSRPSIRSGRVRLPGGTARGEVVFENVSFGYNPSVEVLKDVSFQLREGETLGIVGPTGSGKSTLLRLLMRFYDVDSGRILLDGRDIQHLNLRELRKAVSLVSQDVYLFPGTVRENVLYGRPHSTKAQVVEALREAGALDLLESLPRGLETEVGERGHLLSGGERQRVAIARALLKGAPILLLDEATSHLDYETEFAVKRSLQRVTAKRSVVMIAHRLSTIRDADRIIVFEKGRIREMGSHQELLAQRGLYASLWAFQSGEQTS